jgi:DNA-binding CsgD family transcriptional regulator
MPSPVAHRETLVDFKVTALGDNPHQTARVLTMHQAGASRERIIEVGHWMRSWTAQDVDRILANHRATVPEPPDPRPHSVFPTSARTVLVSANEAAVSHRICQAMTNEEIAGDLGMSPHTVKTHVRNVLRKAECRDRVALVVAIYSGKVALTQEER